MIRTILPAELAAFTAAGVRAVATASGMTLAIGEGTLRGHAAAGALFADFFAIRGGAALLLDAPEAWGGAIWRAGPAAWKLHLASRRTFTADEALGAGLADALVPAESDPVEWAAGWLGNRSDPALETAAALIRRRGGDRCERFAFARLFAAGEPQEGLAAFLEKRTPKWNRHEPERN